jgi:hypothetical protein
MPLYLVSSPAAAKLAAGGPHAPPHRRRHLLFRAPHRPVLSLSLSPSDVSELPSFNLLIADRLVSWPSWVSYRAAAPHCCLRPLSVRQGAPWLLRRPERPRRPIPGSEVGAYVFWFSGLALQLDWWSRKIQFSLH